MHMNTRIPVYTDALECWGAEFQKSMSHENRGRCGKGAVLEELADLQIMLNQMVVLYATDDEFKDIINAKLTRLIDRIERSRI